MNLPNTEIAHPTSCPLPASTTPVSESVSKKAARCLPLLFLLLPLVRRFLRLLSPGKSLTCAREIHHKQPGHVAKSAMLRGQNAKVFTKLLIFLVHQVVASADVQTGVSTDVQTGVPTLFFGPYRYLVRQLMPKLSHQLMH